MDALSRLGLAKYESAVYLALLEIGKSTAKNVAEHSAVPPTAVYPALKKLLGRGLIQEFEGDVALFEAISPSVGLSSFAKMRAKEIEEAADEIIPSLDAMLHSKEIFPQDQVVSLSYGSDASKNIMKNFIDKVGKSLFILGWKFRSTDGSRFHLAGIEKLIDKNVDVRLLMTTRDPHFKEMVLAFKKSGIPIRYYPVDNFSIIVCDANECKITLKNKALSQRLNIHIVDPDLSSFLNQYFLSLWKKSKPIGNILKKHSN
jgi:sugar-specific transcriptional regulator TrmB